MNSWDTYLGKYLNVDVTPQQIMTATGAIEYRIDTIGEVVIGDHNPYRVRIVVDTSNRINCIIRD